MKLKILAQYYENYASHNEDWDGKKEGWKPNGGAEFFVVVPDAYDFYPLNELENLVPKLRSGEVTEVVVVEKEASVIKIVGPFFKNKKIKIVHSDIYDFVGGKFDTIYFDIWPDINTDNLSEIKRLHNAFKNKLNRANPKAYMNSWMKEFLQRTKKQESRSMYY